MVFTKEWFKQNPEKEKERRRKLSNALKGKPTWNKGKPGIYSKKTLEKMSKSRKGKPIPHLKKYQFKKGHIPWNTGKKGSVSYWKGKKLSVEHRKKLSEAHKGKPTWMKGKHHTDESKRKLSIALKGKPPWHTGKNNVYSKESLEKMSKAHKKLWQDKEYREKQIKITLKCLMKRPTRLEQVFIKIFKQNNLPFKYVGDGEFILGGKCPDFINTDGQKQVIEVGNTKQKHAFKNLSYQEYERKRTEHFAKYGFKVLCLWEFDLKDTTALVEKIEGFTDE